MNTSDRFDAAVRAHHARSLDHLSPRVRAQLQQRRRAALAGEAGPAHKPWRFALPLATACVLGVLVVGLQFRAPEQATPDPAANAPTNAAPASTAADDGNDYATLEESPDLYVWLASDGAALAME